MPAQLGKASEAMLRLVAYRLEARFNPSHRRYGALAIFKSLSIVPFRIASARGVILFQP